MSADDLRHMETALALAEKGRGFVSPNPMVGAILVKDGRVISEGYHRRFGSDHAEVEAIQKAGGAARGATLYVTLEPCDHFGKTPPCSKRILEAGIARVVSAMEDPNPEVKGNGHRRLKAGGVEVTTGVFEKKARRLNEIFIKHISTGLPFVIAKCAATLDGFIATKTGDSRWVSGEASRRYVHRLRHTVDAIMVGAGTARTDDPSLTTRLEGLEGRDPIRVILDPVLSISEKARALTLESDAQTILVAGPGAPEKKKKAIEKTGARVMEAPEKDGLTDMKWLRARLGEMGISGLLIEGGSRVMASAFRAGIVDKVVFFYAPKIMAGGGFPICGGPGPDSMDGCVRLTDVSARMSGDDVMIEGYPLWG
ncbi:Diaminohydroxyphosphoribosylaminopyrimidine deaminase / 5-amino-6-(5-phosphoribosylamino)uracil reductase [Candidatus Desulfarcum epimagneticum]|uniref:Riboflavin biosynthesis protein RibD n=1 Tax=uncultured Desulfobacteraceae bacterium TaxID=218296 RepID=A0A484HNS1_9BACT|nr:Diaminohydroxyphosphoribosylaminopyrimidine deaminase / 5-amino-6-(5-phosphoribosylamino)uracil reductase [uncultured Desulfobacteraceae bacterium]